MPRIERIRALEEEFSSFKRLESWRSIFEIVLAYAIIFICTYLTLNVSLWFYIPSLILIGNRQHTLALLGHEATHGTLFKNPKLNTWIGKVLCHYPVGISHHRYRIQHLLHHRHLGTPHDPDLEFYFDYPKEKKEVLNNLFFITISGRIILFFLEYYNGIRLPFINSRRFQVIGKGDHLQLLLFWLVIVTAALYFQVTRHLFFLWVLPFILWLPWLFFKVILEHAPMTLNGVPYGHSRTVISAPWIETLLFPIHINYHSEHHLFPWVPHYHLPAMAAKLNSLEQQPDFKFLQLRHMNLSIGISQLWKPTSSKTKASA